MLKVLFIIPTHESNECLVDTLDNIIKFNPDIEPYFVLYISDMFYDFDDRVLDKYQRILITRKLRRHSGIKFESQIESLIKAYRLARDVFNDFDYVSIFHTSQLFTKTGYADYIKNYDFSYDEYNQTLPDRYDKIKHQSIMKGYVDDHNDSSHYKYQIVEMAFYTKSLFDMIEQAINTFPIDFPTLTNTFNQSPIEEIIIPTLCEYFRKKYNLRQGKNILKQINVDLDYELEDCQFTIKSIPRNIDHHLRVKMRNIPL